MYNNITVCVMVKDLAMRTADSHGISIILATDPDADRLALAEKNPDTKIWKIFSGNETGALLSWWAFENYRKSHPDFDGNFFWMKNILITVYVYVTIIGSNVFMMASTVSSKYIRAMAKVEGFQFVVS